MICLEIKKAREYLKYGVNILIAALIAGAILILPVNFGLTREAVKYLAVLAAMVFMLISGVFDEHVVILATLAICVVLGVAPFSTIFSAYSGTTMWMVLTILPITVVIQKSGLMNRIALWLLNLFPSSYKWQLFSLSLSSMLISFYQWTKHGAHFFKWLRTGTFGCWHDAGRDGVQIFLDGMVGSGICVGVDRFFADLCDVASFVSSRRAGGSDKSGD